VINGTSSIEGGVPEEFFVDAMLKKLGIETEPERSGAEPAG